MKKIIFFLITILGINIIETFSVNAWTTSFYEGEYIDGIYVNKAKGGITYYQKARFFRRSGDNKFSYCIEPFTMFDGDSPYETSLTADNLSTDQMNRIKEIIHFGYGYGNHTTADWYALTQFMVWQESDYSGDYYFTDSLNGNRITKFEYAMDEINYLINEYHTLPSFSNTLINLVEDESLTITDTNNVLSKYTTNNNYVYIDGNKLIISGLKEGTHKIELFRTDIGNDDIPLFYNSPTSQNMVTVGRLEPIKVDLTIKVQKTGIEILKVDSKTNSIKPSGEAKLIGAKYQILDNNMNIIKELTIENDNKASISNLKYGKYFIKEIKPGKGYTLDNNIYEIEITNTSPIKSITLKNKVIEKELEIDKKYGDNNSFSEENGISFDIYDINNNLVDTITTNNNGKAKITLPYGTYLIKQRNTTDGYTSIDDFKVKVIDSKKETKELYDYKIKVPNTYHKSSSNILILLLIVIELLNVKKIIFN